MDITPQTTVEQLLGPWQGDYPSGLVERCKAAWCTPLPQLSDLMVATYLNQRIATAAMVQEARRRLALAPRDDSEYFDGQLEEALANAPEDCHV